MPQLTMVTMSGFRVVQPELLALGMTLVGFQDRAQALTALPGLGLITLAGMAPAEWNCSYHAVESLEGEFGGDEVARWVETIVAEEPDLVAISALTASIEDGYRLSDALRARGARTVLGGLHVTSLANEAQGHADAVVVGSAEAVWGQVLADAEAAQLQPRYEAPYASSPSASIGAGGPSRPWPLPRYDLLGPVPRYTLQTQRGCPLACDFCGASRLLESFHEKPLANIRRELAAIRSLCPRPAARAGGRQHVCGTPRRGGVAGSDADRRRPVVH